ncbi:MAG: DUF1801 domain-containing protein [Candidatus Nanopelagicales bacterium]
MAEPKTRPTNASVDEFIESVDSPIRREDAKVIRSMFEEITGEPAVMWGDAIIGFGVSEIPYADGSTKEWPRMAFSPRKANTTIYFMEGFDSYQAQLATLGKQKSTHSCLYITNLKNVDLDVLHEMFVASNALYV